MFALITQKFQSQRAGLLVVGVLLALMVSGCTHTEQSSSAQASAMRESSVERPMDDCPNLPGMNKMDELPDGIVQDYDIEKGFVCIPIEEVHKRLEAMERQRQEMLAQATLEVLGPQPLSETTAFDRTLRAVAYYCNHSDDRKAETAARLVYDANNMAIPPSNGVMTNYSSFDQVVDLACGIPWKDPMGIPPSNLPEDPAATFHG